MQFYNCPYCIIISNRKFNLKRHINRKHPGEGIPNNLLSYPKNGLYSCPYCLTTSNRKYNLKEHINRKHPGEGIPNNLNPNNQNFPKSALTGTPSSFLLPWLTHPNHITIPQPPLLDTDSRKENRNNSFFKLFVEFLGYMNFIENQKTLQFPDYYQNENVFKLNPLNVSDDPLSNIDFGKPLLFKIYKCTSCFRDTPYMVGVFDNIKISSEYICPFNCNLLPRINEANKNTIDPKVKVFSINKIFSIIDKKVDPKAKLCLKSIKIPRDFHKQLKIGQRQFNDKEKDNENNNRNIPSWLLNVLLHEEFFALENTDVNNWAYRLTGNNDNST